ncbi:MAG: hypothetical protein QXD23_03620, partial [Candidatus Micrarchaeaceae archaeon]
MMGKESYIKLFGFQAKSETEIKILVDISKTFSKKNEFILLLDNKENVMKRAVIAYLNGILRFDENLMRTDSLEKEIL